MKKIIVLILCAMLIPSLSFAALDAVTLGDGTSLDANGTAVSLSPNVVLNYSSVDGTNYALTGANEKGAMCYGVESGNQGVYQQKVAAEADNVIDSDDDNDPDADQYDGVGSWSSVGG